VNRRRWLYLRVDSLKMMLARDAFVKTNRRVIAIVLIRLSVRLSVWNGRAL